MRILGIIASSLLKAIRDAFDRTTSGSLGNTDTSQAWVATRGTWYANGSQAVSDTAATSYPIASVVTNSSDSTVIVTPSSGTGVAFWVSDATSWWASLYVQQNYSTPYTYPCQDCYYNACKTCSSYTCTGLCGYLVGGSADTMNCSCNNAYTSSEQIYGCGAGTFIYNYCFDTIESCGGSLYKCVRYTYHPATSTCACGNAVAGTDPNNCGCCCQAGYDCYPSSCTGYNNGTNHYLRLIKSVGGTVSTATGDISLGQAAAKIVVATSGTTITAKAYSDSGMTSQLGSTQTYTPSSPTTGVNVGIIKAPSDNQNNTVDNFSAS